jgi:hypothetical protein
MFTVDSQPHQHTNTMRTWSPSITFSNPGNIGAHHIRSNSSHNTTIKPHLVPYNRATLHNFVRSVVGSLPSTNPLGDLDNSIHPMFHRLNFQHNRHQIISLPVYAAMMPALRLTSLLVTERAMLGVFDHIANGFLFGETKNDLYIEKGPLEGTPLRF